MILDYFGLKEQPFGVTPNPAYLWMSSSHREALASLIYALESDLGFSGVIAEPGMGKTTLLFSLLERVRSSADAAFLFHTQCTREQLLRYVVRDFGINVAGEESDPVILHEALQEFLLMNARKRRRVLMIIDEAQNLSAEVLEYVRLLSDFETRERKLLHIVLAGQLQLAEKLLHRDLEQLTQRLAVISELRPLEQREVREYIEHRLRIAGLQSETLFTDRAYEIIAAKTGGVPRNVNRICLQALSLACALGKHAVDETILAEVAQDLDLRRLLAHRSRTQFPDVVPPKDESDREIQALPKAECAALAQFRSSLDARGGVPAAIAENTDGPDAADSRYLQRAASDVPHTSRTPAFGHEAAKASQRARSTQITSVKAAGAPWTALSGGISHRAASPIAKKARSRFGLLTPGLISISTAVFIAVLLIYLGFFVYLGSLVPSQAKASVPVAVPRVEQQPIAKVTLPPGSPATHPSASSKGATALPSNARPQAFGSSDTEMRRAPSTLANATVKSRPGNISPDSGGEHRADFVSLLSAATSPPTGAPLRPPSDAGSTTSAPPIARLSATSPPPEVPVLPDAAQPLSAPAAVEALSSPVVPGATDSGLSARASEPAELPVARSEQDRIVVPPEIIRRTQPNYPITAKAAGIEGKVVLACTVETDGRVHLRQVVRGHPLLASAATSELRNWRFKPATVNGMPVAAATMVVVDFQMNLRTH